MTSCEVGRSSAYHSDLRWRMVWQRVALGLTYQEVAKNLGVDKSTVYRTTQIFLSTGNVAKKPYPKEKCARKLTLPAQLLVLHLVIDKPSLYLSEIQSELETTLYYCMLAHLRYANFYTSVDSSRIALQQDQLLRNKFILEMTVFSENMFVFVDESGADIGETFFESMDTAYVARHQEVTIS